MNQKTSKLLRKAAANRDELLWVPTRRDWHKMKPRDRGAFRGMLQSELARLDSMREAA